MSNVSHISVVMPVYNGERYLGQAIESILGQSWADLELIVVDDGSTDGTRDIIASYPDARIVCLHYGVNCGVSSARNAALGIAHGKYIAILDSDDIALPERLSRQLEFLEAHPEIGVLGSAARIIDAAGRYMETVRYPASHEHILWRLCYSSPLVHSTVMLRRRLLEQVEGYDPMMRFGEDYDLWRRLSSLTRFANLQEPLVFYRRHAGSGFDRHSRGPESRRVTESCRLYMSGVLGEEVPFAVVSNIGANRFDSPEALYKAAEVMYRLWRSFDLLETLNPRDRRRVRCEAAYRLYLMARMRLPDESGRRVLMRAWWLDPPLPGRVITQKLSAFRVRRSDLDTHRQVT